MANSQLYDEYNKKTKDLINFLIRETRNNKITW